MAQKKININHELVEEKSRIIGGLIDGMRLPEVFTLIGTLVINVLLSCDGGKASEIKEYIVSWLENLASQVRSLDLDEPTEDSKYN